jgi:hypothetical protein
MKYKWLLLLLALISTNVLSYQPSLEIFEKFDDVKLVAFINESDIENYPLWNSLSGEPPISISGAIQAVKEFHNARKESAFKDSIKEIELRQMSAHRKNYWHYLVKTRKDKIRIIKPAIKCMLF